MGRRFLWLSTSATADGPQDTKRVNELRDSLFFREGVDAHLSWGTRGTFPGEAPHCGPLSAFPLRKKVDCKVLPPHGKTVPEKVRENRPSLTSLG